MELAWGIDLGGTKTEIVVLDRQQNNKTLIRERIPTNRDLGYDSILNNIKNLILETSQKIGCTPVRIGIGTPGSIDPNSDLLRNSNTTCLNGKKLVEDLEELLKTPVKIKNDADCFAIAEALLGSGVGHKSVFGVILGTGVGGGLILNGEIISGKQGLGGEWGHNPLLPYGPKCFCGKLGCVETIISGPALENFFFELSQKKLSLEQIVNQKNSPCADYTINRLLKYLAKALGTVINIFDPDIIILGGGVSNIQAIYSQLFYEQLKPWIFHENPSTIVVKNKLGDSAGVLGAALISI